MEYTLRKTALPTYYRSSASGKPITVSRACKLGSEPITALHYHSGIEIGLCISGNGDSHIDDRIYRHHSGCILVARAYQPHLSTNDEKAEGDWIWMTIDPQLLLSSLGMKAPEGAITLIKECGRVTGVFEYDEHPELGNAVSALVKAAESNDKYSDFSVALAAAELMICLARLSKDTGSELPPEVKITEYSAILPAIEYISAHLDEKECLAEASLASRCRMSVSNLRRLFHVATGMSPKNFITRSRMAYAEYLLRVTQMTVLDISIQVGYGEISGFNRVFARHFGTSPGRYRAAASRYRPSPEEKKQLKVSQAKNKKANRT